jgi:hypothetical protein
LVPVTPTRQGRWDESEGAGKRPAHKLATYSRRGTARLQSGGDATCSPR